LGIEKNSWKIIIYNRWGSQVYESNDYHGEWAGGNLSGGTYFYKLENNFRPEKKYFRTRDDSQIKEKRAFDIEVN
jgi:hypothetical protein